MACLGTSIEDLRRARAVVDQTFALVEPDSLYERPIPQRHRIIFYVGHLEAFDLNLLRPTTGASAFAPAMDRLFALGIDPPPGCLPSDLPAEWPEISEVRDYCARAQSELDTLWSAAPEQLRHVAKEHRLMHAETLAYMLHNLPTARLVRPQGHVESVDTHGYHRGEVCEVPAGTAYLGRSESSDGFGWDNEFSEVTLHTPAFVIDRWKVTNGDYLRFVEATGAPLPFFWLIENGKHHLRRMFDAIPLPLDWPVYVTHEQASAYAAWRGGRLPSEAEWHRAAEGAATVGNFDGRRFDPEPVTANAASASAAGVEDLYGNGWEWTSSLFRPFPQFEPFSFYQGYSSDFFDDDHYVLKGASPRTDSVFTRRSFRNWFRKDYPYVFASFRCIHNRPQ